MRLRSMLMMLWVSAAACGEDPSDARMRIDGGAIDAPMAIDAATEIDAAMPDGVMSDDAATPDGGTPDGGTPDGGTPDAAMPDGAMPDGAMPDATAAIDAALPDATSIDAAPPSPATLLVADDEQHYDADLATDAAGNAMVVWEHDGRITARRFRPSLGWGAATIIDGPNGGADPHLAVAPSGEAMVVWWGGGGRAWTNRYTPAAGWGTAAMLAPELPQTGELATRVAIDPSGDAIAIWTRRLSSSNADEHLWTKRYTHGVGWGAAVDLGAAGVGPVASPQLAISATGDGVAVWGQDNASAQRGLWAIRYDADTGWDTPTRISDANDSPIWPRVAMDPAGNAIAIWASRIGSDTAIRSNRFVPGTGWGAPIRVDGDDAWATDPQIAIGASGSAMAVWYQSGVRASRFVPGTGWSAPELLANFTDYPQVAVDGAGAFTAVWAAYDGDSMRLTARRFAGAWGAATLLDPGDGDVFHARVAAPPAGQAVVVWEEQRQINDELSYWRLWGRAF